MNRIEDLFPKVVKKTVGSTELDFHCLSLDEMSLFDIKNDTNVAETMKVMKKLVAKVLKLSEEDVGKISVEYLADIISIIFDIHKMEEIAKTDRIKAMIEKHKKATSGEPAKVPSRIQAIKDKQEESPNGTSG